MATNPRNPKNVKKLIADAQARQVENAHASWLAGFIKRINDSRKNGGAAGGGTRKKPR